jgi:hypothetical protein
MKFTLLLALLLSSLSTFAHTPKLGWICSPMSDDDFNSIQRLRLPPGVLLREIGILVVDKEKYCGHPHIMIYRDFCRVKGNDLAIGLDGFSSLTTRGGVQINLYCEEDTIVNTQGGIGGSN